MTRYHVRSTPTAPDGAWPWADMTPVLTTNDMGEATEAMLDEFKKGRFACQVDTMPATPKVVTAQEREALATIMPGVGR